MICRVCGEGTGGELWPAFDNPDVKFHRCYVCGSDSSDADPGVIAARYQTPEYRDHVLKDLNGGDEAAVLESLRSNVEWFRDYRAVCPGRDFLDVGHNDGLMLRAMQEAGWSVHGFDVNPQCDYGPHTTIRPFFAASHFPRQYDAVCCREVVEHVDGWRQLLVELYRATKPRGVCTLQTPIPGAAGVFPVYQDAHLQIFSPIALEVELRKIGWDVRDRWLWPTGAAWMMQRPG